MTFSNRQDLFSGTEAVPPDLSLDLGRLKAYLDDKLDGMGGELIAEKFKGGQSNPTYKITSSRAAYVLRRRPPGELLASAHAIDREYKVMQALGLAGFPVPHTHLYCSDAGVIGSEFYIVSFHDGHVFWNAEMPGTTPGVRSCIYDDMNSRLSELHQLDATAVGLESFGKAGGYAARNLKRWSEVYARSKLIDIPDMTWLINKLPEMLPKQERCCLIHGDYGLYNLVIDVKRGRIETVLDWEMSTLGDPMIDLAHHLRAWWEVPDPQGAAATSLKGQDLVALGIPAMDAYVQRYCRQVGLSEMPHRKFYLGYAQFRNAAMVQGILKRAQIGTAVSRANVQRQDRVVSIAALARQTLESAES